MRTKLAIADDSQLERNCLARILHEFGPFVQAGS